MANAQRGFRIRAIDPADNIDTTSASYSWMIDTDAPTVTIQSPSEGSTTTDRTPTITATVKDNTTDLSKTNVKLFIDSSLGDLQEITNFSYNTSSDTLTYTPTSNFPVGTYTVYVTVVDQADNSGRKSWTFSIVKK
jgi:hypothetical protein